MSRARQNWWLMGVITAVSALLVGAFVATNALGGLMDQRDRLQAQVGALQRRQPTVTVSPPTTPTPSPEPSQTREPDEPDEPAPGGGVSAAGRPAQPGSGPGGSGGGSGGGGGDGGGSPGRPGPPGTPADPPAEECPDGQLLTVSLPLGALPCDTVVIGGAR